MLLADPVREELPGRPVSKSGMLPLPVVKHLDVIRHIGHSPRLENELGLGLLVIHFIERKATPCRQE